MSFIEIPGLNDVKEPVVAPEDIYELVIAAATLKEKEGKKNIFCVIEIEGGPDWEPNKFANCLHNVSLPTGEDEPETRKTKMLFMRRFFHQFGVPFDNGFDIEALPGCRGKGKLKQDEYNGELKSVLVLDKLPSED